MTDTRVKPSAEQKRAEASEAVADYRAKEAAAHANMLRLRAERLAREAANASKTKSEPVKPKPRRRVVRKG
jgi:hypothetical protein